LVQEAATALYVYRLSVDGHSQTGLAACYSLDDMTATSSGNTSGPATRRRSWRHMPASARTGPVFLTYRASAEIDGLRRALRAASPCSIFRHLMRSAIRCGGGSATRWARTAVRDVPVLYIADGRSRGERRADVDEMARGGARRPWGRSTARRSRRRVPAQPDADPPHNRTVTWPASASRVPGTDWRASELEAAPRAQQSRGISFTEAGRIRCARVSARMRQM
jgi:hypothetical protein